MCMRDATAIANVSVIHLQGIAGGVEVVLGERAEICRVSLLLGVWGAWLSRDRGRGLGTEFAGRVISQCEVAGWRGVAGEIV